MNNSNDDNNIHHMAQNILSDLAEDGPVQVEPGERLWKLYVFRPAEGRSTRLEHRIYVVHKPDDQLAMITFAVHSPSDGLWARSGIVRVPSIPPPALSQVIESIRRKTNSGPDEYDEIDLSRLPDLDAQVAYLRNL